MTISKKVLTNKYKLSCEGEISKPEVWKDIKGYEGLYQVSNMGRVKSLGRTVSIKNGFKRAVRERILRPCTDGSGYLVVNFYNGSGKRKAFLVHRLVCEAFHENSQNKPEVNHINEDKLDNRACNLEWVTRKENINHGTRNARVGKAVSKALSKSVGQYTLDGKLIKVWQSTMEIQRQLGFNRGNISAVARGERKTANGYVWKYIEEENS